MKEVTGYKLFRVRKDGTLGPLFINAALRVPMGEWMPAEEHPTKGFAFRPGWHAMATPEAPHLSEKGRAWFKVKLRNVTVYERPGAQGGKWYLAREIKVIEAV